ncbi:MAG: glutamate racemase, partial [Ralstonia mannitolilytica]
MTTRAQAPVGVFDSGLGGLSVLRAIRAELPAESLLYLADSRHAPYGEKSPEYIADRTLRVCEWLVDQGCKALVIACNTATAQAVHVLREKLAVPVIGVEPGLKPAVATSKSRVVGVLATESTLRSEKFARLLAAASGDCQVLSQPGYGLVPLIERGDTHSPAVLELLQAYLQPMLDANADTLVLGCTHYPFLEDAIREIAGDRLTLIDTGHAVARHLGRTLAAAGLHASGQA